jgi:hypothetical protein
MRESTKKLCDECGTILDEKKMVQTHNKINCFKCHKGFQKKMYDKQVEEE